MIRVLAILALVVSACSSDIKNPTLLPPDATIDAPSATKELTAFGILTPQTTGAVDSTSRTVSVMVPFGTDLTALVATFTTTGATVKVGSTVQTSAVTVNNFHQPVLYTVAAADGSSQVYTVTVMAAPSSVKTITGFAFANPPAIGTIDEAAKAIAITVPFGTVTTSLVASYMTMAKRVLVNGAVQTTGVSPNDFTLPVIYTAEAYDGTMASYTVTVTVAPNTAKAITSFSFASPPATGTFVGQAIAVAMPFGTNPVGLVATFATTGAHVRVNGVDQTSGVTPNDFTSPVAYVVTAGDGSTATYTVTVTVALNPAKAITAFGFTSPQVTGAINEPAKTISVALPFGTSVTALVATFTTTGASVKVGATVQTNGATPNDFTSSVAYVVTAGDGSTATYMVTVTVAQNPAKELTAFSFANPPATGAIDEAAKTITITVPFGTTVTGLVATFTTTGANVKVGATTQVSGVTPNNFTNPVAYVVTAGDGSTATYAVTMTVAANASKAITAYSFASPAATGVIDEAGKTIAVTVPFGTPVTSLVATFATTGASVKVGGVTQTSTVTQNNFTNPITYTVTAADATTAIYTVTVTVTPCTFISATGGTVTTDGNFKVHTFLASGTFTISCGSGAIESLVVAGGGGGGSSEAAGGGGAGGLIHTTPGTNYSNTQSFAVTVGSGGVCGMNGTDSAFDTIIATGGGAGGGNGGSQTPNGAPGGSGGGGNYNLGVGGPSTGGQGTAGGAGRATTFNLGGGGGGCSVAGENGIEPSHGGFGGLGCSFAIAISGVSVTYASGGGGGADGAAGGSVSPGGGGGGGGNVANASNGMANTGGGGGGNALNTQPNLCGLGGSGIVILRFKFK